MPRLPSVSPQQQSPSANLTPSQNLLRAHPSESSQGASSSGTPMASDIQPGSPRQPQTSAAMVRHTPQDLLTSATNPSLNLETRGQPTASARDQQEWIRRTILRLPPQYYRAAGPQSTSIQQPPALSRSEDHDLTHLPLAESGQVQGSDDDQLFFDASSASDRFDENFDPLAWQMLGTQTERQPLMSDVQEPGQTEATRYVATVLALIHGSGTLPPELGGPIR